MSFYTQSDIISYRAGWLETHPNEVLDDETVIDCLKDEHIALIDALIDDDLKTNFNTDFIERVLREGHVGYEEMTVGELWQEMEERGLTL